MPSWVSNFPIVLRLFIETYTYAWVVEIPDLRPIDQALHSRAPMPSLSFQNIQSILPYLSAHLPIKPSSRRLVQVEPFTCYPTQYILSIISCQHFIWFHLKLHPYIRITAIKHNHILYKI